MPTIFPCDWTMLHPTSNIWRYSFFTSSLILVFICLIIAILMGIEWYLIKVLVCISLMNNDIEHLFMYLPVNCILLWRNIHSHSLPILHCFLKKLLSCHHSLYILDTRVLTIYSLTHSVCTLSWISKNYSYLNLK